MAFYVSKLVFMVGLLAVLFIIIGKINREKFKKVNGIIYAEYPYRIRQFTLLGYCIVSIIPLLIAPLLKETNPVADRVLFLGIHLMFLMMILWTFNRRIVVGVHAIATSNFFGQVRIMQFGELSGAVLRRHYIFVPATTFSTPTCTVSVDDHMLNCAEVVAMLTEKLRSSQTLTHLGDPDCLD